MFQKLKAGIQCSSSPGSDVTPSEEDKKKKSDVSKSHLQKTRSEDVAPSRWASLGTDTTGFEQSGHQDRNNFGSNRNSSRNAYELRRTTRSLGDSQRTEDLDRSQRSLSARKAANFASEIEKSQKSIHLDTRNIRVLNLDIINHEDNIITRSTQGKTSGVFFVTEQGVGESKAALKPVNDSEIIANKFFEVLEVPIPKFDVWDVNDICDPIREQIDESFQGKAISKQDKKIMVMERIEGRPLSECDPAEIKEFLLNNENLDSLGRTMVFDMFIGNADRIFYFLATKVNPDNIMVKEGRAIFIDQVFTQRPLDQWKSFHQRLMAATNAPLGDKTSLYEKYISPLVERSLNRPTSDEGRKDMSLVKNFKKSIDEDDQLNINIGLSTGIHGAIQDLISKKVQVLNVCEHDTKIHKYVSSIYEHLEAEDRST